MKLWILERKEKIKGEIDMLLIRAETERDTRLLAVGCDNDNPEVWENPDLSECENITCDEPPRIIMISRD